MESMNKQHKETVDMYQKDIETKKINENKLLEEVRVVNFYCNFLIIFLMYDGFMKLYRPESLLFRSSLININGTSCLCM